MFYRDIDQPDTGQSFNHFCNNTDVDRIRYGYRNVSNRHILTGLNDINRDDIPTGFEYGGSTDRNEPLRIHLQT